MLNKIKGSIHWRPVKIALAAVVVAFISVWLPWLADETHSQSLAEAFSAKPDYFTGMPAMVTLGMLWTALSFLLFRRKLALLGLIPMAIVWGKVLMTASDYGLYLGIGFYLYIISVVVCVVMALRKLRVDDVDALRRDRKRKRP